MSCSWSLLFTFKWEIIRAFPSVEMTSVVMRVIVALSASLIAFIIIYFLDMIDDQEDFLTEDGAKVVTLVIESLGMLVGFSWEQAFEGGVGTVARTTANPMVFETVIALGVVFVVSPAWAWYILPNVLRMREEAQKHPHRP